MPKQKEKWKPTAKLLAAALTTFVLTLVVAWLENFGVDLPPSTIDFLRTLVEPLFIAGATFVIGFLKPPSSRDQITE